MVQFFESEESLEDAVSQFLGTGLATGEMVVVIATAAHRGAFWRHLTGRAFDLERAQAAGLYTEFDARDTIAGFKVEGSPDAAKFMATVGSRIAALQRSRPGVRIRVFDEMVDLLWGEGNPAAALELESLWGVLCGRESLSLLCAYNITHFDADDRMAGVAAVCQAHDHTVPSEQSDGQSNTDGQLRELTLLQQRAAVLSLEVARHTSLEDELRQALLAATEAGAVAEETVRYNEMFTRMLGHDLRNPLNAIVTTASYISRLSTDPKLLAAAKRITSSSLRMARMIEQLLDFTRIRVGAGLRLVRAPADLHQLCHVVAAGVEADHPGHKIVVAPRGNVVGEMDAGRMLQVLSNLLTNAVQYGEDATQVRVDIDGSDAEMLALSVRNAGAVPPGILPALFEPVHDGRKGEHTQGLGLGLYLTRQLVLAHGGEIAVHSSEAGGTVIRVELPRHATVDVAA